MHALLVEPFVAYDGSQRLLGRVGTACTGALHHHDGEGLGVVGSPVGRQEQVDHRAAVSTELLGPLRVLDGDVRAFGAVREGWPEAINGVWEHFLGERFKPYVEGTLVPVTHVPAQVRALGEHVGGDREARRAELDGQGIAYGYAAGTVKTHRDVVKGMTRGMNTMAYYIVLAYFAQRYANMRRRDGPS